MTTPLINKVAFVTGGSRGIGAAIVERLARDGAQVAFTYSASQDRADALVAAIAAKGGQALAIKADAADADAVSQAVALAVKTFGDIDILVNNAGILLLGQVGEIALADFDKIVSVNVRGVFVATQEALRHMHTGGRIITIGSVNAERAGFPGSALYSMTKGAVALMMRGFARDLAPRGITVNTVQPGPTDTEIISSDEMREAVRSLIPLGRTGQAAEIANFVAFLAGQESSFITGSALTIDGGYLA
ncbi:Cyclic-di-GMP-binding biofilm dispersal mediator protein [compost metagenome]